LTNLTGLPAQHSFGWRKIDPPAKNLPKIHLWQISHSYPAPVRIHVLSRLQHPRI